MRTLLLVTGLAWWTCVVGAGHAGEPTRRFNPLDATYTLENETITLVNGKAASNAEPGSATRTTIGSIGHSANGDLNGDGVADAAIVLIRDAGGSGAYYYVAAAINIGGRAEGTDAKFLGDRITLRTIRIVNRQILVTYLDRKPGEPLSAKPTIAVTKRYALQGRVLTLIAR
jgi:hypothetical protein